MSHSHASPDPERRDFFRKASAVVLGGLSATVPVAAGIKVLLDPLGRASGTGELIKITTLDTLPTDGVPRQFTVVSSRTDAWNRYASTPVGAIYLRRLADGRVEALHAVCPHAGCFIDYAPARGGFFCPCHNSSFTLEGKIAEAKSPSPRPMDTLETEIRNETEVWVKFQNFRAGHPEKLPVA